MDAGIAQSALLGGKDVVLYDDIEEVTRLRTIQAGW